MEEFFGVYYESWNESKNREEVGGEGRREETPPSLISGFCFLFKLFIAKAMEILTMLEIGIQPYNFHPEQKVLVNIFLSKHPVIATSFMAAVLSDSHSKDNIYFKLSLNCHSYRNSGDLFSEETFHHILCLMCPLLYLVLETLHILSESMKLYTIDVVMSYC